MIWGLDGPFAVVLLLATIIVVLFAALLSAKSATADLEAQLAYEEEQNRVRRAYAGRTQENDNPLGCLSILGIVGIILFLFIAILA